MKHKSPGVLKTALDFTASSPSENDSQSLEKQGGFFEIMEEEVWAPIFNDAY